jgi:hypothetical protein
MKALGLVLVLFALAIPQEWTNYNPVPRRAVLADSAKLADSTNGGAKHALAADSAYKTRDSLACRLGLYAPLIKADSATVPKFGGTAKMDTVYGVKGMSAPVFVGTKLKVHGVVIDSISVIDASGASADTLIFGIGGKAFKVWSDVGQ